MEVVKVELSVSIEIVVVLSVENAVVAVSIFTVDEP